MERERQKKTNVKQCISNIAFRTSLAAWFDNCSSSVMLFSGALGGGLAAYAATDNFRGVGSILLEMDEINKQKLFEKVTEIFEKASLDDVKSLHTAAQDPEIRGKLLKVIIDHVENQLQINIVD